MSLLMTRLRSLRLGLLAIRHVITARCGFLCSIMRTQALISMTREKKRTWLGRHRLLGRLRLLHAVLVYSALADAQRQGALLVSLHVPRRCIHLLIKIYTFTSQHRIRRHTLTQMWEHAWVVKALARRSRTALLARLARQLVTLGPRIVCTVIVGFIAILRIATATPLVVLGALAAQVLIHALLLPLCTQRRSDRHVALRLRFDFALVIRRLCESQHYEMRKSHGSQKNDNQYSQNIHLNNSERKKKTVP